MQVKYEFTKEINERPMDFASLFFSKNDKNLSCMMLEKGLLRTNILKNGDNAS